MGGVLGINVQLEGGDDIVWVVGKDGMQDKWLLGAWV